MPIPFYLPNRHKLMHMVNALHHRGYGLLRVIPSMSPSGMHWRCKFLNPKNDQHLWVSNWLCHLEIAGGTGEITHSVEDMADLFIHDHTEFMADCKGIDVAYVHWYSEMLDQLIDYDVPYAFADWQKPKGVWMTFGGKTIPDFKV